MFENDLGVLPTRDLLEAAAECRAVASRADARVLECAQVYADRFHPAVCGVRPGRRVGDGRERAVVLGGEGCPEIAEFAVAEFGVVVGVSPGVGRQIIADGLALRHRFPRFPGIVLIETGDDDANTAPSEFIRHAHKVVIKKLPLVNAYHFRIRFNPGQHFRGGTTVRRLMTHLGVRNNMAF